jgi:hypothetical protein
MLNYRDYTVLSTVKVNGVCIGGDGMKSKQSIFQNLLEILLLEGGKN